MWTAAFDRVLRGFWSDGALEVTYADGTTRRYGPDPGTPWRLTLHDPALPRELLFDLDMAFGEAWVDQRLSIAGDDLRGFLAAAIRQRVAGHDPVTARLLHRLQAIAQRWAERNPLPRARANVQHHYDLSGALYDLFLDADRQYSCAYFTDPEMSLEAAQEAKKRHIARKLCLAPGMRVLDIGCGWGGMALTLARDHGAQVVGVTLSDEQHAHASGRVAAAGLADRIDIRLADYRDVDGPFDRIVSVGMFEHVGAAHYGDYFGKVRDLLTPDGVALVHTIGTQTAPRATSTWLRRYIFPGGYLPALSEMLAAVEKTGLTIADIEVLRLHYARTLRHWHDRFMANVDAARNLYDEKFTRVWRYYLTTAELSFVAERLAVFQVQLARCKDAVPLTRDYLYSDV
ncbi:MAG: cyclopropane-fatty-acyl-phospholipid synthase [Rhodobacteraceae bacterium HLUCCA08]|nr:MAG: cyclopropane-fatty-acyl-phospholipid synthase [Rhodobacteraceae bacterium HLUCCA08]